MEKFIQNNTKKSFDNKEKSPSEYQTERFLNTINQPVLDGIISEMLSKSGIEDKINTQVSTKIVSNDTRSASGWHINGEITINAANFDFNLDHKKDYRRILSTYIHEYVHACAIGSRIENTGFKHKSKSGEMENVLINEGFTELIADYVYEEYLRRTGEASSLGLTFPKRTVKGYLKQRLEAIEIMKKISLEYDVPEEIVFDAYIRAYFTQDIDAFEHTLLQTNHSTTS